MTNRLQAMHDHLAACRHCREHPFELCELGRRILMMNADAEEEPMTVEPDDSHILIDIAGLDEDHRVDLIGPIAESGDIVGFVVEDEAKANRYLTKLFARYRIRLIKRSPYMAGTVLVQIGPVEN